MCELFGERTPHVLAGNRMVDALARIAAADTKRRIDPVRAYSRFDDPYLLFCQENPSDRASPRVQTNDPKEIYWNWVNTEWTRFALAKDKSRAKQGKPLAIAWADDETVDTKRMALLWHSRERRAVQLHTLRERICRKELPERAKIHNRIADEKQGEFWRQVYSKRGLHERYSSPSCPLCGAAVEQDNHFATACTHVKVAHTAATEEALASEILAHIANSIADEHQLRVEKALRQWQAHRTTDWMNNLTERSWLRLGIIPKGLAERLSALRIPWKGNATLDSVVKGVQTILLEALERRWHTRCDLMAKAEREAKARAQQQHAVALNLADDSSTEEAAADDRRAPRPRAPSGSQRGGAARAAVAAHAAASSPAPSHEPRRSQRERTRNVRLRGYQSSGDDEDSDNDGDDTDDERLVRARGRDESAARKESERRRHQHTAASPGRAAVLRDPDK
jgi:hypothetical protein